MAHRSAKSSRFFLNRHLDSGSDWNFSTLQPVFLFDFLSKFLHDGSMI
ncbi:hypothetical protein PUN4_150106 [Paraburkholderia unamae]|nr:hypothetical protein PUN4_150106 [Paraburkholderia unamae]